ncbi:MAG TPA: dihydrolipoyl dehydrogenase [Clostridiales bacterium]|nr:dihydrolipoyl dehydrogenase [Clostridiales bacterium]
MIYDLIVIGGGPGGYLASERAGGAGLKTLCIEKANVGGVCLNEGCIPSKTLLHSAKVFDYAKGGEKYGVTAENVVLDQGIVIKRKDKVVRTLVAGVKAKLKQNNVEVVNATAAIKGRTAEGFVVTAGDSEYIGKRLLIATGSVPSLPPIPGLKEGIQSGFCLTNKEILDLKEIPECLTVIGGGVIGLEMASYYHSVGSKVTVIEMLDHIAGNTDSDISDVLLKEYTKKGIDFKLSAAVVKVNADSVVYEKDGKTESVKADKVLVSIGRRAQTSGLGAENIGLELNRGTVVVDDRMRTNVAGVYAVGDVTGKMMLAHVAYRQAEVFINNILGKKDVMRYNAIPSVIYTNPEVAGIGETESTAKAKGLDVEKVVLSMNYSGRYAAENERGTGICKILTDKKNQTLVGVHMIGNYASEIIYGAAIMIECEMRIEDIKEIVFPHPTVSEIIREGIFEL